VNGEEVTDSAEFFRALWALGPAGIDVPLTLYSGGDTFDVELVSTDRNRMLKAPRMH
jgi:S1-C subfamily serine protease